MHSSCCFAYSFISSNYLATASHSFGMDPASYLYIGLGWIGLGRRLDGKKAEKSRKPRQEYLA